MKRILFAAFFALVAIHALLVPCFAADTEPTSGTVQDVVAEDAAHGESVDVTRELFTQAYMFAIENKQTILEIGGSGVILVVTAIVEHRNKKRTNALADDVKTVKGDAAGALTSQGSVIDAVNGMIGGYNSMRSSYEKYEHAEEDRNRLIGAVMVQNTALLEILTTIYVNNKNLPQGVKDLVTLRYVNCQKALGDDETLLAIVESVREKIDRQESEQKAVEQEEV